MAIKPRLQALLLADHVYTDEATGKVIIAGTFDCIFGMEFPTEFQAVSWVYVCLSEIRGKVPVCLRYVDLETNEMLMETHPIEVSSEDMLASRDFVLPVPPIPMPHEGVFAFELYAFDDLLGSLRIMAITAQEEDEEEDEEEGDEEQEEEEPQ